MKKPGDRALYERIRDILESARMGVVRTVNTTQVIANWLIGREIVEEEQRGEKRAKYGAELIRDLAQRLTHEFGQGYSRDNLFWFRRFYGDFPDFLKGTIFDAAPQISQPSAIFDAVRQISSGNKISDAPRRKVKNGYARRPRAPRAPKRCRRSALPPRSKESDRIGASHWLLSLASRVKEKLMQMQKDADIPGSSESIRP